MAGISKEKRDKLIKGHNGGFFFRNKDDNESYVDRLWFTSDKSKYTCCYDDGKFSVESVYTPMVDVIGCDHLEFCTYDRKDITVKSDMQGDDEKDYIEGFSCKVIVNGNEYNISAEKIGVEAARKLMEMIDNPPEPTQELIDLMKG